MIHPSSVISPKASVHESAQIGPFCYIGDDVTIGADCVFHSHVSVAGKTTIGEGNEFFPFSAIGQKSQDLKYKGEPTSLIIGDRNVFREGCTIHRSTNNECSTTIGHDNLFLCYSHIAHECVVGNHVIMSNEAGLAGHVHLGDYAIISAKSGVHQFCRVGAHCIIGGLAKVTQDVAPYTIVDGAPAMTRGINTIGLQRRGFEKEDLSALKTAYKKLFLKKDANLSQSIESLRTEPAAENTHVQVLLDFVTTTERGVTR